MGMGGESRAPYVRRELPLDELLLRARRGIGDGAGTGVRVRACCRLKWDSDARRCYGVRAGNVPWRAFLKRQLAFGTSLVVCSPRLIPFPHPNSPILLPHLLWTRVPYLEGEFVGCAPLCKWLVHCAWAAGGSVGTHKSYFETGRGYVPDMKLARESYINAKDHLVFLLQLAGCRLDNDNLLGGKHTFHLCSIFASAYQWIFLP
ncbi:hypothetical protein K438DRAFT_1881634 [Mycena galopus ATCC 62051]|nr:hypothetical protein K438DRAFT_1881634 [Mycena galopus ATCC 62051]